MQKFSVLNFLINFIVAMATGVLTFLISRDSLNLETGSMAAAAFAGAVSGMGTCLGYEVGMNNWSNRKGNVLSGLAGALFGAGVAACIGLG